MASRKHLAAATTYSSTPANGEVTITDGLPIFHHPDPRRPPTQLLHRIDLLPTANRGTDTTGRDPALQAILRR